MTRYTREHKQQTRQRILEAAAGEFRERGIAGVSIPRIMGKVGLTHGDFYAHFASKDALVADACSQPLIAAAGRLHGAPATTPSGQSARAVVDSYLSSRHRDAAGEGCVVPALAGDISRESPAVRQAFTRALEAYLDRLASVIPPTESKESGDAALAMLATMAGGILLARAVDDPTLSDRILGSCRDLCKGALAERER